MARLPNDCFSNPTEMLTVKEARILISQSTTQVTSENTVEIRDALERILARNIYSKINVPPSNNSAVDGYAFVFQDYSEQPNSGREVVGVSAAGRPYSGDVKKGQCVKIFTGALMPLGCDTVAMIEDIIRSENTVILPELKKGSNCRLTGEDIKSGNLLLARGTRLRPQDLGYLATIGLKNIPVFNRLKVAIVSTGDELTEPGQDLQLGGIYDSNRYTLGALLKKYDCDVIDYGIERDNFTSIRETLLRAAEESDLILTSGGVSMGDEDHVKAVVENTGSLHFWRIAIKPGRPLAIGQIGGTAFVGLPGNPVAALICAAQFVRPMISNLSGEVSNGEPLKFTGRAAFSMKKKRGRREWLRGLYSEDLSGQPKIEKFDREGSGIVSSLVWANGLIELEEELVEINEGDTVNFLPFTELFK